MTKKRLTLSVIVLSNLLSLSVMGQGIADTSQDTSNENVSTESVQKVINEEVNDILPNTNMKSAIAPSMESREVMDADGNPWGEAVDSPYFCYDWNKDGQCDNCKDSNKDGICDSVAGMEVQENTILAKGETTGTASYTLDENGFLIAEPPVVTKGVDSNNMFYKYWRSEGCNLTTSDGTSTMTSCWSPAFPKICYKGYNKGIENITDANDARDFFGVRDFTNPNDPDDGVVNRYNNFEKGRPYQIQVKVRADDSNGTVLGLVQKDSKGCNADSPTGNNCPTVNLLVNKWATNTANLCLNPNFNYTFTEMDNGKTDYIETPNDLSSVNSLTANGKILPCAMFTPTAFPSGYKVDFSGKTVCSGYNMAAMSLNNLLEPNYTRYQVFLPTGPNTWETTSSNSGHYLNVRQCALCEDVNNHCETIVRTLMKNTSGCTETGCSDVGLDNLVKKLREGSSFDIDGTGTFGNKLQCNACLDQLENILRSIHGI